MKKQQLLKYIEIPYPSQPTSLLQTRSCEKLWNHSWKKSSCLLPNFQKTGNNTPWTTQLMCSLYMLLGVPGCWPLSFKVNRLLSCINELVWLCDSNVGFRNLYPGVSCLKSWNKSWWLSTSTTPTCSTNPEKNGSPLKLSKALEALHRIAWDVFWPGWCQRWSSRFVKR